MRIGVYTISKNEEKNARQWAMTTKDADFRLVLDTGSSDQTVELLRAEGVAVIEQQVHPWRFDVARNIALAAMPEDLDVCVSLDLDETLCEGWREAIEHAWNLDTTMLRYRDIHKSEPDGAPREWIFGFRVHARFGYVWRFAIHECLVPQAITHVEAYADGLVVTHRPDPGKSRRGYGELLARLVKEEPHEPRYWFFHGYHLHCDGYRAEGNASLRKFIEIADPLMHSLEIAKAWRLLALAQKQTGGPLSDVVGGLLRAAAAHPLQREGWFLLAIQMAELSHWPGALAFASLALQADSPSQSLTCMEDAWNGGVEDLFLQASRRLGIPEEVARSHCSWRYPFRGLRWEKYFEQPGAELDDRENERFYESHLRKLNTISRDPWSATGWERLAFSCAKAGHWALAFGASVNALAPASLGAVCGDRELANHLFRLSAERLSIDRELISRIAGAVGVEVMPTHA